MSVFPKTDLADGWGRNDTEGGPHASFYKRYAGPLRRYARIKFPSAGAEQAEDLVQAFFSRELGREAGGLGPIFRRYRQGRGHGGRFRYYLAQSFWRFARDELEKESRRRGRSLASLPDEPGAVDPAFDRLIAREFLNAVRERVLARTEDDRERAYFALKWPEDIGQAPLTDRAIGGELGLTDSRLRRARKAVLGRVVFILNEQLHRDGLDSKAVDPILADYGAILDDEQGLASGEGR